MIMENFIRTKVNNSSIYLINFENKGNINLNIFGLGGY